MSILSNLEQYINRFFFIFLLFILFFFCFFSSPSFCSISNLPAELRKNMQSIRVYDIKQQALHAKLLAEQSSFIAHAKSKRGEDIDDERLQTLKEQYRTVLALCDKKINLANGAYEMLDEAIRKLDLDLRKSETELEQKELNLTAAERRKRKVHRERCLFVFVYLSLVTKRPLRDSRPPNSVKCLPQEPTVAQRENECMVERRSLHFVLLKFG
jgi:hypothetical protein